MTAYQQPADTLINLPLSIPRTKLADITCPANMAERTVKSQFAPDRDNLPSPEDLGVTLAPDALELAHDSEKLAEAYGPASK